MSIFDKWNENVDSVALAADVAEAERNGGSGDFEEVPSGKYEVCVDKLELKESKKGDPMFVCWFKVLEGGYKNSRIFMNQVITQGFQIAIVNKFLRSLDSGITVDFDGNYSHYNDVILDVAEHIDGRLEYALEYGRTERGFPTFKIVDVFES